MPTPSSFSALAVQQGRMRTSLAQTIAQRRAGKSIAVCVHVLRVWVRHFLRFGFSRAVFFSWCPFPARSVG